MQNRTAPPGVPAQPDTRPVDIDTMRVTARKVTHGIERPAAELAQLADMLRGHVQLLVPEIRAIIATAPLGDPAAEVAQVGIDEAWRRLHTTPGFGPDAVTRHTRKLALSVCSLCDHYENLRPRS